MKIIVLGGLQGKCWNYVPIIGIDIAKKRVNNGINTRKNVSFLFQ